MFEYYGKGVVTKDNDKGEAKITVSPIEIIRDMKGPITSMVKDFSGSAKAIGAVSGQSVKAGYEIEPIWFSLNSDRTTPPYVIAGEEVVLLTIPNSDMYFWGHTGDKNLRKLEKVNHLYSNKEKALDPEFLSKKCAVSVTVDTIKRHLTLTTPKNRKEPMTWMVDLDYKEGILLVENSVGDLVKINGVERHIDVVTKTVKVDAKTSTFTGDVIIEGKLDVTKATTLKDSLTVFKDTTLKAALSVLGGATISKALSALKLSQSVPNTEHGKDHLH